MVWASSLLGAWHWCLGTGGKAEQLWVGIVCGSMQAYPTTWETASSDSGGGHSASHYSTTLVGSEMQYTKIIRPKQPFCAAAEQIPHNKYRGKRWEISWSLMGMEQSLRSSLLPDPIPMPQFTHL